MTLPISPVPATDGWKLEAPVTKFIAVRSASRAFGLCLAAPLTAAMDLAIVDLAGDPGGIRAALGWLQAAPFKERDAWLVVSDGRGTARIESLTTVAAPTQDSAA
jgi:hypothetical protein